LGYDKKINCYCESTLLIYKQLSGSGIGDWFYLYKILIWIFRFPQPIRMWNSEFGTTKDYNHLPCSRNLM
jgi:hypothetical protein